ncbi:16013_t:CDS:2 [Acaulospora colombiana]|uniref:16013_t:CDS:1 n=1 Tax=Acaulospora colombiana TaxID=27376 RepID=A0ACA9MVH6_9GLOM|nr:16013_t:CDS:2 [Acaulospora colombiana]
MSNASLKEQRYGKNNVRLAKVIRTGKWHEIVELTVCVLLEGDFTAPYTEADNSKVVATDSIKNTIYILAKQSSNVQNIEVFATEIGLHFVTTYSHVSKTNVSITKYKWTRMLFDGKLHNHSFHRDGEETHDTKVIVTKKNPKDISVQIESGLKNLLVLKTTGSAFYGFLRDKSKDRILSTNVDATWTYNIPNVASVKNNSASVQATLFLMAKLALEKNSQIESIHYELPNIHYFEYDLDSY